MKCPSCRAEHPDNWAAQPEYCKCGYALKGKQADLLACLSSIERSARGIKSLMVFWLVLTAVSVAAWFIVALTRGGPP